jgi:DNA replication protein DnaC
VNQNKEPLALGELMRQQASMTIFQSYPLEAGPRRIIHPWPEKIRIREEIDKTVRLKIRAVTEGQEPWPILFWGEAGSGKSCAALCVLDYFGGLYLDAAIFAECRRLAMQGELWEAGYKIHETELWKPVRDANLVVMDELGVREKVTDHQYETVKRVMDNREEKPAIYVSNLPPVDLARVYDDRIASRATSGTVIGMIGDRRRN